MRRFRAILSGIVTYFRFIGRPWETHPDTGKTIRFNHAQAMVLARVDWDIVRHEERYGLA